MATPAESESRRRVREMTERGLTPREISAVLGISTQAVYKHLERIRKAEQDRVSA